MTFSIERATSGGTLMKRNSHTAVIYARVSSTGERQSTARQVADLTRYAEASGMEVVAVYEEKASGWRSHPISNTYEE